MQKTARNRYIENIGFKLQILYRFPKINIAQHYQIPHHIKLWIYIITRWTNQVSKTKI